MTIYTPHIFNLVYNGIGNRTASLEIIASSPGLTPCLANSLAAYPYVNNIQFRRRRKKKLLVYCFHSFSTQFISILQ